MNTEPNFTTSDLIGTVLSDRYRIIATLASGGMSTVYIGFDIRLERQVAIKIISNKFSQDPRFQKRFEQEARVISRICHPGIVTIFDQCTDEEQSYIVMELVIGGTVRDLLHERGPMPPYAAAAIFLPFLEALSVAHSHGIIHRDIKPENILISKTGEIKIVDFGLLRTLDNVNSGNLSSESIIMGTSAYISPEQILGDTIGFPSDVYSAGITLYEMLTGTLPFAEKPPMAAIIERTISDVPAPSLAISGIDTALDAFVQTATHKDPQYRYADASQMAEDLGHIILTQGYPHYDIPAPTGKTAEILAALAKTQSNTSTRSARRSDDITVDPSDAIVEEQHNQTPEIINNAYPKAQYSEHHIELARQVFPEYFPTPITATHDDTYPTTYPNSRESGQELLFPDHKTEQPYIPNSPTLIRVGTLKKRTLIVTAIITIFSTFLVGTGLYTGHWLAIHRDSISKHFHSSTNHSSTPQ